MIHRRPQARQARRYEQDAIEQAVRGELERLIADAALARALDDAAARLQALQAACLFYPVFADWPTPVDAWLDEGQALAAAHGAGGQGALFGVRRAFCHMRRAHFAEALAALDAAAPGQEAGSRVYALTTRARVLIRMQDFAPVEALLAEADALALPAGDWTGALRPAARAELALQRGELDRAAPHLRAALARLPVCAVEERVQALQSLGYVATVARRPDEAYLHLAQARAALRGAGVWPEVVQMDLACAGLLDAAGKDRAAEALLREAAVLDREHCDGRWAGLCELMLARVRPQQAAEAALRGAREFAQRGDGFGYAAALTMLAQHHERNGAPAEAYRVLSLGLGIARALRRPWMEAWLAATIEALRERLGAAAFERIAAGLLREAQARRPAED